MISIQPIVYINNIRPNGTLTSFWFNNYQRKCKYANKFEENILKNLIILIIGLNFGFSSHVGQKSMGPRLYISSNNIEW